MISIPPSAPFPDIPGYTLRRVLGSGRWSNVYEATQDSLSRTVAVKVLTETGEEFRQRFEREAEIMASITHPNVVNVVDRGQIGEQHFLVMEHMPGGSLRDQMTPHQPLATQQMRDVLRAVTEGLKALHKHNLIHRDVKPGNVLVDADGRYKLSDFGITVATTDVGLLTQEDASPGTYDYMAPEQRTHLAIDERTDQFALAVMSYELLTGWLPGRVYQAASSRNSQLAPDVDSVFERALQDDPDDRFEHLDDLFEALDSALAKSKLPASAAQKYRNRNIAIVCAVLFTIALAALGKTFRDSEQQTADAKSSPTSSVQDKEPAVIQTGALPFRVNEDGQREVLLVTARTSSHWTIPKANQKTTKTLQQVAEEEAFEEAGVQGVGLNQVLGSYCYKRKGRRYRVSVVPVLVSDELRTWPEEFRDRRWIPASQAPSSINDDELRRIVATFSTQSVGTMID